MRSFEGSIPTALAGLPPSAAYEILRLQHEVAALKMGSALAGRGLLDQVMIWASGPDKGCIYFNEAWLAFTGRGLAEELGNGWASGVHPDDLDRCMNTYAAAFDTRDSFQMAYRLRRHDGEYRCINDIGAPCWDTWHRFVGFSGSCIDVTETRCSQLPRRVTPVQTVSILTPHRYAQVFVEVDDNFEALLGYPREQVVDHPLRAVLRHSLEVPIEAAMFDSVLVPLLDRETEHGSFRTWAITARDDVVWFVFDLTLMSNGNLRMVMTPTARPAESRLPDRYDPATWGGPGEEIRVEARLYRGTEPEGVGIMEPRWEHGASATSFGASFGPRDDHAAGEAIESVWELHLADGHLEGVVVWANQQQAALFGLDRPEDAIGKTIRETTGHEPPAHQYQAMAELLGGERDAVYSVSWYRAKGEAVWVFQRHVVEDRTRGHMRVTGYRTAAPTSAFALPPTDEELTPRRARTPHRYADINAWIRANNATAARLGKVREAALAVELGISERTWRRTRDWHRLAGLPPWRVQRTVVPNDATEAVKNGQKRPA
jgi:PAS domain S-box-containing protein